ncbi:MAG: FHA domain-containing protein [Lachnospiraceae bacterium]|nr:FHA domain-containing protein [Lachnospiraceae bacterium]
MKASFIQKYLTGVAEAIIWVGAGCLLMFALQANIGFLFKILCIIFMLIVILAGKWCICRLNDKNTMQANEKTGKAVTKQRQTINPLDDAPARVQKKESPTGNKINSIALIGEQGNILLEWSLAGKTSLVIGKGTDKEPVDIDLTETAMGQLVSKQHAVLNYTDNGWYVDDIDSKNGTRVKKRNQSALLDVKLVGAVEVEAGDIIYISNTMLQLR